MGPPTDLLWNLFNTKVTFKKEIGFYKVIVPTLAQFSQRCNRSTFNFFPTCIGSRLSLEVYGDVDKNCILLLENLKNDGFMVCDRVRGFDKDCTEMILRKLAVFHALPIVYKIKQPNEFNKKFAPLLNKDFFFKPSHQILNTVIRSLTKIPDCIDLKERIETTWEYYEKFVDGLLKPKEPFATIAHHDFWINNIMMKFNNRTPIDCKMIDFQMLEYSSPAHDLILFLFTSVQLDVLQKYINHFIELYYVHFEETLINFECDVNQFSLRGVRCEINNISKYQFAHVMFIMVLIYTKEGTAKDLSAINSESDIFVDETMLYDGYFQRLEFVLKYFKNENWI